MQNSFLIKKKCWLCCQTNLSITKFGDGMIIFQIFARYAKYEFGFERFGIAYANII